MSRLRCLTSDAILVAGDGELLAQLIFRPSQGNTRAGIPRAASSTTTSSPPRSGTRSGAMCACFAKSVDRRHRRAFRKQRVGGQCQGGHHRDFGREVHVFLLRDPKGLSSESTGLRRAAPIPQA